MSELDQLDSLVGEWLTLPDVAELLEVKLPKVRRMLDDDQLIAVRRGSPKVLSVPKVMVDPEPLHDLPGTLTVLRDAGYSDLELLVWLFTPDEALPGSPIENLRAGRNKTEIRRRAQASAF